MPNYHRILAVDDDPDILELIRLSLMKNYEIFVFQDPIRACKALELVEPDLLILDIMMPKMTGYQVVELIRGHSAFNGATIMFLTAKDAQRDVKYGYSIGASVYLTKPFQPARLLRNVDVLLSGEEATPRRKHRTAEEIEDHLLGGAWVGIDRATHEPRTPLAHVAGYPGRDEAKGHRPHQKPSWM